MQGIAVRKICKFCSSEDSEIIFNHARFEQINILRCKQCELVCMELDKTDDEIIQHYRHDYRTRSAFPAQTPQYNYDHPVIIKDANKRTEWIKSVLPRGGKILEIGAGSGRLVEKLKTEGYEVCGIELTEAFVNFSKNKGLRVLDKPIQDLNLKNEFDLVVTFHCFEHILQPKETLIAVLRALVPGGVFLGEVPSQDDWRIKIFDNYVAKRFHYDPNHYFYFNAKTLSNFLKDAGFADSQFSTVERYNSLLQLTRIISGEYTRSNWEKTLERDIYVEPKNF